MEQISPLYVVAIVFSLLVLGLLWLGRRRS